MPGDKASGSTSHAGLDIEMDMGDALSPMQKSRRTTPHVIQRSGRERKRVVPFLVILGAVTFLLYKLVHYIFVDPMQWPSAPFYPLQPASVTVANITYLGARRSHLLWDSYHGIPYAQAPVGSLRFREARPVPSENPPRLMNASSQHPGCPRLSWFRASDFIGVEDCLRLDVHTPSRRPDDSSLPVMVWIHGGSFYSDSTVGMSFSLDNLMTRGAEMNEPFIAVKIQYRLGILGFSSDAPKPGENMPPHVPTRKPDNLDLNVGFKDQIAALRWVQNNIHLFGGDPRRVVLVGHEAGAISASLHMLYSPKNLFAGAFLMSGAATSLSVPFPHDAARRTVHPLGEALSCPDANPNADNPQIPPDNQYLIQCMRTKPLSQIMKATLSLVQHLRPFPWYPVVEGKFREAWLDMRPSDRLARASFNNRVPAVVGTVLDEGTRFVRLDVKSDEDLWEQVHSCFDFDFGAIHGLSPHLAKLYPDIPDLGAPHNTGNETFGIASTFKRAASLLGDVLFLAPARFFLNELAQDFAKPVYSYRYSEPLPGSAPSMGVSHGADLGMWLGCPPASDSSDFDYLSRYSMSYLVSFINHLDPNGPGLRPWAPYGRDHKILHIEKGNISLVYDNDRHLQTKFINLQNPLFSR